MLVCSTAACLELLFGRGVIGVLVWMALQGSRAQRGAGPGGSARRQTCKKGVLVAASVAGAHTMQGMLTHARRRAVSEHTCRRAIREQARSTSRGSWPPTRQHSSAAQLTAQPAAFQQPHQAGLDVVCLLDLCVTGIRWHAQQVIKRRLLDHCASEQRSAAGASAFLWLRSV